MHWLLEPAQDQSQVTEPYSHARLLLNQSCI